MIQKSIFLIILQCCLQYPAKAQDVDATFNQAEALLHTHMDSSVRLIERLGEQMNDYSSNEQLTFHHKAAAFYNQIADFRRECFHWEQSLPLLPKGSDTLYSTLLYLGMAYLNAGEFKSAKASFERTKRHYTKTRNKLGIVQSYNGIAGVLTATGDCKAAVDYYFDAIRIIETMGDNIQLTRTYSNLSIAYTILGEKQKALEVRRKSYHYALLSKDEEEIHFGELNLGGSYNETGQPDSAVYYLNKGLVYYKNHFNAQILNAIYNELGRSYSMTGQNAEAENYYLQSIDLLKRGGFNFALPGTLCNYGLVLFHKGEYKKGIQVCQEALPIARKIGYLEVEMIACNCLYLNFKADKQADSALVYYEYQVALKDSITNTEIQKATLRKELESAHSKEKEGIISTANEELNAVVNFRNVLIIGSSILLLALFILFYSFRQKKRSVAYIEREKQYLDDLVHNLVHEFRTPLTLIKGPAEELIKTDEQNTLLQLINRNSDRMLHLVNQVLDFSKLKAGKLALNEEVSDLNLFLAGTLDLFEPLALQKNISLRYTPSSAPSVVMIDSDKLFKVVSNLLSNAIKYSGDGSDVHLTCARENNRLIITIQDSGIGIPPEELKNVFLKFYQVDATTTRKEEGTGLGLAFVDELIRLMKGTIELSSIPGKGTTVRTSFPFVAATVKQTTAAVPGAATVLKADIPEADTSDEQKHSVLVIDDNVDLQVFLRIILEEQGYDVSIAENGEKGIEVAIETVPDIIISDVMMPKKDGYQVVQALKEHPATEHIPIILLTAKASFDSMIGGLQTGADDYLSKPFKSQELLLRVNNHIRHQLKLQEKYLSSTPLEEQPVIKHSLISKIETIVQHEDGIHCTVEQVAEHCAMSRSQLHRKVKFLTGLSTTALLTKIRLDFALKDVTDTDMTISEISYKFGYSDPANFSRLFKKQFNQSPSEFRNSPF